MYSNTLDITKRKQISQTQKAALTGVMGALIALTTVTSLQLPAPLASINFAPVVIFVVCIIFGPIVGSTSTAIGCAIGYVAGASLGTIGGGFQYIFLIGLVVARTPMALVVGVLRKKSQIGGMILGVTIETFIFFAIDFTISGIGYAIFDLGTFVDLAFIPVAFVIIVAVQRFLGTKYYS